MSQQPARRPPAARVEELKALQMSSHCWDSSFAGEEAVRDARVGKLLTDSTLPEKRGEGDGGAEGEGGPLNATSHTSSHIIFTPAATTLYELKGLS